MRRPRLSRPPWWPANGRSPLLAMLLSALSVGRVFVGPVLDGLRLRGSALQSVGRPPLNPGPAHLAQSPLPLGGAITGVRWRGGHRVVSVGAYRRGSSGVTTPPATALLAGARRCAADRTPLWSPRGGAAAPRACGPPPPRRRVSWRSFRRGPRAFRRVCGGRNLPRRARAGIGHFRPREPPEHPVAPFGDAPLGVAIPRLVPAGNEPDVRAHRAATLEARRVLDGQHEPQGGERADARHLSQQPRLRIEILRDDGRQLEVLPADSSGKAGDRRLQNGLKRRREGFRQAPSGPLV